MSVIEAWETYDGTHRIHPNPRDSDFQITVQDDASTLPDHLDERVNTLWNQADMPYENDILFLTGIDRDNGETAVETNVRPFRYTFAFNRNEAFYPMWDTVREHDLLSISTHAHLVSRDDKLLYAPKINQMNQISGFSGFPDVDNHVTEIGDERYLDIYKTIEDKVGGEIHEDMNEAMQAIYAVGLTFVDTPGLRGTDSDYVIELDMQADDAVRAFEAHYEGYEGEEQQFAPELHTVDFEPGSMADFIRYANSEGREMSRYAMGCMYAITRSLIDAEKAHTIFRTIRDDVGVPIAVGNTLEKRSYLAE